jgi:hypothetical protein
MKVTTVIIIKILAIFLPLVVFRNPTSYILVTLYLVPLKIVGYTSNILLEYNSIAFSLLPLLSIGS